MFLYCRQCQKCRYDRCLSAGMRPELVMSEEQKRVRFRNVAFGGGGNGGEEQVWNFKLFNFLS